MRIIASTIFFAAANQSSDQGISCTRVHTALGATKSREEQKIFTAEFPTNSRNAIIQSKAIQMFENI